MYCTRCGKKIDYDSFVCNECRAAEDALLDETKSETVDQTVEMNAEAETVEANAEPINTQQPENTAPQGQYYYSTQNTSFNQYQAPQPTQPVNMPVGNPRMIGFGKSLASTILSFFGYIFSYIALVLGTEGEPAGGLVIFLMTLGLTIPALILGIQSIKTSSRVASQGLPRPIATLVMGIVGLSFSGISLFICLITFFVIGMV